MWKLSHFRRPRDFHLKKRQVLRSISPRWFRPTTMAWVKLIEQTKRIMLNNLTQVQKVLLTNIPLLSKKHCSSTASSCRGETAQLRHITCCHSTERLFKCTRRNTLHRTVRQQCFRLLKSRLSTVFSRMSALITLLTRQCKAVSDAVLHQMY